MERGPASWNLMATLRRTLLARCARRLSSRGDGNLGPFADQPHDGHLYPRHADVTARGGESDGRGAGYPEAGGGQGGGQICKKVVSLNFASWNRIGEWLRQLGA